ncbi:hypothetical protein NC652_008200 [Populus alba x Populus x berolinensis]|nr:hypothetical protein NC652_008200 [Populus alba x Populus x berolinensis]
MSQAIAMMSSLMSIAPQKAVIAETREEVDADEAKLNIVLAVKAGTEVIPIDAAFTRDTTSCWFENALKHQVHCVQTTKKCSN